ncbi:hypothetical protein [Ferrimonas lipolytica]|uniref:Uncharacterized protein n=1 Tax=Ferrimonas lipolytica TaxID=2724191 RepID=A0A6H1UG24_9GAMM|nr:hypothetical protein [Ferrimonas lipolytica]QIZ77273.1 hypothetical protein HER31_10510 [Ferrimonas lipolytica]
MSKIRQDKDFLTMMNKNSSIGRLSKPALALMLLPLLNACGSDSDNKETPVVPEVPVVPVEPETPEIPGIADLPAELAAKFDLLVEAPKSEFDGTMDIYLGRWYPCQTAHLNMCDEEAAAKDSYTIKAVGEEGFEGNTKYNLNTPDNSKYHMEINAEALLAWKSESIRSDIFQPGHFSVLDVMMYISEQREDFEVSDVVWNEARQAYDYKVSFDADGDGNFDTDEATHYTQWKDYNKSPNWGVSFFHSGGKMLSEAASFETVYDRLGEMLVRHQVEIRIMPMSPAYMERMWQSHIDEVEFKKANDGKVMLTNVLIDMEDTDGYKDEHIIPVATNVEVKAYNLRTDVFKPGVITQLDYIMSAAAASATTGEADFGFTYWPTLSTGTQLGSYVMNRIDHPETGHKIGAGGLRADGFDGWNYAAGMDEYTLDVMLHSQGSVTAAQFVADAGGENFAQECEWLREDDGSITEVKAQECIDHWSGTFGGNKLHIAMDQMVRNHGMNYIYFSWVKKMFWLYGATELNSVNQDRVNGNEYLFPTPVREAVVIADISKAVAPLSDTHFGWGIADCAQCHNEQKDPLGHGGSSWPLASGTEVTEIQPFHCASCHGNNGAMEGHGETSRCFWCHSEDYLMKNHGDASTWVDFSTVECGEESNPSPYWNAEAYGPITVGGMGSCSDNRSFKFANKELWDGSTYKDQPAGVTRTVGNSDWHTSDTFPDTYSCVTCHVNPKK